MAETLAPCGVTVQVAGRAWFLPEASYDELLRKQAAIDELQSDMAALSNAEAAKRLLDTAALVMEGTPGWAEAYPDEASLGSLRPSDVRRIIDAWNAICAGDAESDEASATFQP
jgi:hypothetical protein